MSSAPSSASGTRSGAGFELRLERGSAYVRLADQPIAPGLELESLTLQVPDVKFPFDVGQGAGQFRHRLADLVEVSIAADASAALAALAEAGLAAFGVEDVRLALRDGFAEIAGRLSGGPAFTLEAGLLPEGDQGVALVFHSACVLGPSPLPAAALPHLGRTVLDAIGSERLPPEPLAPVLRRVLAARGWKLPRAAEARLARAEIAGGLARLAWDRDAAGPVVASASADLLDAVEGARTFREAEGHVARGDLDAAREAYLAAGPAATSHPFAAERLLSLLSVEERFHEEALDLAAEWLSRRPGFAPALAAEAAVRLARGEEGRAAHALAALAEGAAARGAVFLALAAAEEAFSLPGAAREDALRAVETALGLRRDHVPALRALRALARAAGDREALVRANRRLVAYDPEPASKARAHAELGELLLEADPPGARLHLDQALRLAPEDADALAALARACAGAGEPLRAVRAVDRLRELFLARGDAAAAARAALEAGALWEDRLGHAENALLRYREACDLAPSADAHARAARAAEKSGQWAEAADHHAAVLAALDLASPGAPALAARTRVALADVAEHRLGDRAGAATHLEAAAALGPGDPALLRRLVALERDLGRATALCGALDRLAAVEADPAARAALLAEAGAVALDLGRAGDARSRFAAAIAADGACRPALLGLSRLARERGDAVTERDALTRLLPLAAGAEAADVQDRLADACERAGDLAAALAAATAARAGAPTPARLEAALRLVRRAGTPAELATILADRARAAQAAGDAAAATDALVERARLLAPEQPALALAALAEARATSPGDGAVLRAQAELAERTGDPRLALGCLRALLAAGPADAPALDLRAARAALGAGEPAAAREHAERALDRGVPGAAEVLDELLERTGDDGARAEVLARLGRPLEAARLFERHGDPARARAALERAAADPALAPQALPRLADLRLAEGDRAGAAAALLALARLTSGTEGAELALRAHALGRDPLALDVAVERDPSFALSRARRAELRAAGDPRGALADAEAALAGAGLPDDERPALLALATRVAAAAGDLAAARRHLGAYCEVIPDDDAALARLVALHRAAGAREDLEAALARRVETATGEDAAAVRLELSDLVAPADPARAARLALEALALEPGSLAALRALARPPRAGQLAPAERAGVLARLAAQPGAAPAEAAEAQSLRARLLADAGDLAGALEAARDAARLGPVDDAALELRAALAARAGDAAEAARALLARAARAADAADPSAAERLAEAGLAALAAAVDGGEAALRRARELGLVRETARPVLEALARLSRARGDEATERADLAALCPLLPTGARPVSLLRLASLALAAGDVPAARASAEEARTLSPRDPAAVEGCRVAALAQGDLVCVAELLGDLAALEPAAAGPRQLDRARLLASLGEARAADAAYAAALAALPPDRALADEHARHRRDRLAGRAVAEPLEAYAGRAADPRDAARALRVAAAAALAGGDPATALRCARRAYARTQDDLAFAAPLLARVLYLAGAGAEALVLHRRLVEAGFPGVDPGELVALCREAAELAEDAGELELALAALDRLAALRPQDLDAALRRAELDPDRARAARDLAAAAGACRSRRRGALALARAAELAARDAGDADLAAALFERAREAAAPLPALAAELARRRAASVRATEGASSPAFLSALHDAAAAAEAAADRAATRDLLEQAVSVERERGLFADAARDLLQLDALAAAEGDFAESAARIRAAAALLREAGDVAGAAEALRRAYAQNPESFETYRQLEDVARSMGPAGAPLLVELCADRAARAAPGPARAETLVALANAHAAAGAPVRAEAALRAALEDDPGHARAEERLLALLESEGRGPDRARLLLDRAARLGGEEALRLRRDAGALLAASRDPADRALAAEAWGAVAAAASPGDVGAARAAAGLLLGLGRRDDALPHLEAIFRADPGDEAAAAALEEAWADRPVLRAELSLARAAHASGEARAARLREAGRAFFEAGDEPRARAVLRDAFDAFPADAGAFVEALREGAGDVDRLDAVLRARAAAVPAEAAACHRARADALQASGDPERAIAAYEAVVALDPEDVDALASLATCLAAARGDVAARPLDARVVAAWEAAPARVAAAAEAPSRYRLGLALAREGLAAEAVPHLERAVVLAPADPRALEAWAAVARGHAARGDAASALAAARVRVNRAATVGPPAELDAALADEARLAAELGVALPPPAGWLAAPGPAAAAPQPPSAAPAAPPNDLAPGLPLDVVELETVAAAEPPPLEAGTAAEPPGPDAGAAQEREAVVDLAAAPDTVSLGATAPPTVGATAPEPLRVADVEALPSDAEPVAAEEVAAAEDLPAPLSLEDVAAPALEPEPALLGAEHVPSAEDLPEPLSLEVPALAAPDLAAVSPGGAPSLAAEPPPPEELDPVAAARALAEHAAATIEPAARAVAWSAVADALVRAGAAREDVREALDLACEADADSAEPWRARARFEGTFGDRVAAARAHLSVSIRTEGEEAAHAALEAARLFEDAGRDGDAVRAYRAALHARPGSVPAHALAAEEALAGGDAAKAADVLAGVETSALAPADRAAHLRRLGRALEAADRVEAARAAYVASLELCPGHAVTLTALAALDARGDAWTRAAAALWDEAAAAADPAESAAIYVRLARVLSARLGDGAGAIAALRGATTRVRGASSPAAARVGAEVRALLAELGAPSDLPPLAPGDASGAGASPEPATAAAAAPAAAPAEGAAAAERDLLVEADPAADGAQAPDRDRPADEPPPLGDLALEGAPAEPEAPFVPAPEEPEAPEDAADPAAAVEDVALDAEHPEAAISFEEGERIETSLPPLASHEPAEYARDGRLRMETGDFGGAYERLSIALAREPSDLTVARDLGRVTEQLGLYDEYVQLGELCADAIAAYDPLAAAARFRHFAEVLRDRLGLVDRAGVMLEKALALVPDDADTRRELVQLWTSRVETAPRALDTWLEIARRDPTDGEALAGVVEVAARLAAMAPDAGAAARHLERSRVAGSLATFVARAYAASPGPARRAAQVPVELRARVAAPGATGPLARLVRLLAPFLEPLFPADLGRRGATQADRLDPVRSPALAAALDGAARALWARPHAAFVTSRPGLDVSLENTQPPALIATAAVAALPEASLAFLAARTLDLLDHGWALVGKFSPRDVGILLELACRFAGGAPPALGLPQERAGAFVRVLEAQVPAAARAAAAELAGPASDELAEMDPRAFAAALRRTANRVALLYAGEPGAALRALASLDRRLDGAHVDAVQALALPDLRDLALFALSDPFLDLREAVLG